MKNQALFSSKDKSKKLICHLLQFSFGFLRVKAAKIKRAEFANSIDLDEVAHIDSPHMNLHCVPSSAWIKKNLKFQM